MLWDAQAVRGSFSWVSAGTNQSTVDGSVFLVVSFALFVVKLIWLSGLWPETYPCRVNRQEPIV